MIEQNFNIRLIQPEDNDTLKQVLQSVLTEFGYNKPGFAFVDPEMEDLFSAYNHFDSCYFVLTINDEIAGGAGIQPLKKGTDGICELQKMYCLPAARGNGYGQMLLDFCLRFAKGSDYATCYLETTPELTKAIQLYQRNGFHQLSAPLGSTGHTGCHVWMSKTL